MIAYISINALIGFAANIDWSRAASAHHWDWHCDLVCIEFDLSFCRKYFKIRCASQMIANDGVVVVDELPTDAQVEPVFLRVADLRIGQLEIPANCIRRADRRVLVARAGVLHLRRQPQPTGRMQIHLEPEAVQQVGVIDVRLET